MGRRGLSGPRRIVLDTCAVIWLANGEPMADVAIGAIRAAQSVEEVYVSPITAWEIATKAAKGKLELDASPEDWFDRFLALPGIRLAELTPRLLIASAHLPGQPPRDPADRIIIATAHANAAAVVTRDRRILSYLGTAGAIPC